MRSTLPHALLYKLSSKWKYGIDLHILETCRIPDSTLSVPYYCYNLNRYFVQAMHTKYYDDFSECVFVCVCVCMTERSQVRLVDCDEVHCSQF